MKTVNRYKQKNHHTVFGKIRTSILTTYAKTRPTHLTSVDHKLCNDEDHFIYQIGTLFHKVCLVWKNQQTYNYLMRINKPCFLLKKSNCVIIHFVYSKMHNFKECLVNILEKTQKSM